MCGIAGILKLNSNSIPDEKSITQMISTLGHRGPDGWGVYVNNEVALGHSRLSIVDLAGGHQPMVNERYAISYNGEIYNYIEIKEDLIKKGIHFSTTSDTEVVLKAFQEYGTKCFTMFNGQFAILLWDKRDKKLIVARDRYGIRPLYILKKNNSYYFSSEMKAFDVIHDFGREYDLQNLYNHALFWNTLDDKTVYKNIRSLPGGTFEIYSQGQNPQNFRYYEIGESQGKSPDNINDAVEEFYELLNHSVKLRLRSDVPVGAYLSGGIDSSVITYLTNKNNKKKFKTFSVTFEDNEYDESSFQNDMSSKINSEHIAVDINYQMINDNFFEAVYHFERPVFRTAGVPLYILSKAVKKNDIKVVLTGEGADEILFGYDSFKELKLLEFWSRRPQSKLRPLLLKKLYPHLLYFKNPKKFGLIKMFYEGFLNNFDNELTGLNIRTHNNQILSNYFNKEHKLSFNKEKLIENIKTILPDNFASWTILQKNQFLEMKTLLSGYLLSSQGDRMSMAHGVEGRYPFLDHRLVEKIFYYKDHFKLNGFAQKFLLGKAFNKHIPSSIINRPKKPYTAPDLKSFFRNNALSEQASYFLSESMIKDYGTFNIKFINRLIHKFTNRMPLEIGYRDNMLITFILSCQMAKYWSKNPKQNKLNTNLRTVRIIEH